MNEKLIKIYTKDIAKESIVFTEKTRLWCQLPYPDHPNGCPNYGKNANCPPKIPYDPTILSDFRFFTLVYAVFDYKLYLEERSRENPDNSAKQNACVLYWQNTVKKHLKERTNSLGAGFVMGSGGGFGTSPSMEAMGINVIKTLQNNRISIEIKPKTFIVLVALHCSKMKQITLLNKEGIVCKKSI